jgi:hypothetical protein
MRGHTTIISRGRRRARRRRALGLALGICALAIPASASADPSTNDYSSVNAISGDPSESSEPGRGGGAVAAGNAHRTPTELAQRTRPGQFVGPYDPSPPGGGPVGSPYSGGPEYATPNSILGSDGLGELAPVTGSPATSGEGFDWPSAAVGAGAAMALVALGGAALLTVRRRTTVSPSGSAS